MIATLSLFWVLIVLSLFSLKEKYLDYQTEAKKKDMLKIFQMMAHDIRKPFSLFRMLLQTLYEMNFDSDSRKYIENAQLEIEKTLKDVESLLEDILELNRNINISYKNHSIDEILYESLLDTSRILSNEYKLQIDYDLRHTHQIIANSSQIKRVIINILSNAIQAMPSGGRIWIQTLEFQKENKIEICIGNSGSYIPKEKRSILFEDFYSEGKKNGTGLGLSIVKKIILEHQGKIWIESSKEYGTEFRFSLPINSQKQSVPIARMPISREQLPMGSSIQTSTVSKKLILRSTGKTSISILHYDPEPFYLSSVEELLKTKTRKEDEIKYISVSDIHQPSDYLLENKIDFLILNIDNEDVANIQGILNDTAKNAINSTVVLHGYQTSPPDLDVSNLIYIQKPLNTRKFAELFKLNSSKKDAKNNKQKEAQIHNSELIVVIDDSPFILDRWKRLNSEIDVQLFLSPESFLKSIQDDKISLTKISYLVLDFYFGEDTQLDGIQLAKKIREQYPDFNGNMILSSDRIFNEELKEFDFVIAKEPMKTSELKALLESQEVE